MRLLRSNVLGGDSTKFLGRGHTKLTVIENQAKKSGKNDLPIAQLFYEIKQNKTEHLQVNRFTLFYLKKIWQKNLAKMIGH